MLIVLYLVIRKPTDSCLVQTALKYMYDDNKDLDSEEGQVTIIPSELVYETKTDLKGDSASFLCIGFSLNLNTCKQGRRQGKIQGRVFLLKILVGGTRFPPHTHTHLGKSVGGEYMPIFDGGSTILPI